MTEQEVFDKVVNHLLEQKYQASYEGACVYRAPDGASCAVGCLIPDELYDEEMEGSSLHLPDDKLVAALEELDLWQHRKLLKDLQEVHDSVPEEYKFRLEDFEYVAEKYGLELCHT